MVCDESKRGFLGAEVEAEEPAAGGQAPSWRSRRRAAGTHVLFTWVEQSNPRLLQHVLHRLWLQSFLAWLPQSWQVVPPPLLVVVRIPAVSSIGTGFLR